MKRSSSSLTNPLRTKKCCDPYQTHSKSIRVDLRVVGDEMEFVTPLGQRIAVSGSSLWCTNCRKSFMKDWLLYRQPQDEVSTSETSQQIHKEPSVRSSVSTPESSSVLDQLQAYDQAQSGVISADSEPTEQSLVSTAEPTSYKDQEPNGEHQSSFISGYSLETELLAAAIEPTNVIDEPIADPDSILPPHSASGFYGSCSFKSENDSVRCSGNLKQFSDLEKDEQQALRWGSDVWNTISNSSNVCDAHYRVFILSLKRHPPTITNKCCNPVLPGSLSQHLKDIKLGIRPISLLFVLKAKERNVKLIYGETICDNCRKTILDLPLRNICTESESSSKDTTPASSQSMSPAVKKEDLSRIVVSLGLSPLQPATYSRSGRIKYVKQKLEAASAAATKKFCSAFDVTEDEVKPDAVRKAECFDALMDNVREKARSAMTTRKERYQLLTLAPLSWSINSAAEFFGISWQVMKKARDLRNKKGILSYPDAITRSRIDEYVKETVVSFFKNGENSRMMPGKADKLSLGKGEDEQKRLLLCDLRELYVIFKDETKMKIGFSLFCSLRPKYCVLAGASGTHNVCVCKSHQNMKLLLHALKIEVPYRELIELFVCDIFNRECMLRLCEQCPQLEHVKKCISDLTIDAFDIEDDEVNDFMRQKIQYTMWKSTDGPDIILEECSVTELIEIAADTILKLIPHHFIAIEQSNHKKNTIQDIPKNKVFSMMDFGMNWSSVYQDAIQSIHWTKTQSTIHPVVSYFQDRSDKATHKSIVFISNDLTHDTHLVSIFQEKTCEYFKENFPYLSEIEYMVDGCASQYKNCESFLNLCRHEEATGLKASMSFFATSHGKSQCDGLTGIIKRLATKKCLQLLFRDHISDAKKLYEFCLTTKLAQTVHFIYVDKSEVELRRETHKRNKAITVPGTRSFHNFVPLSGNIIGCKRVSTDKDFALMHSLCDSTPSGELIAGDFVVTRIEKHLYLGMITDVSEEDNDAELTLMMPKIPSQRFKWPNELKTIIVPFAHILGAVTVKETLRDIFVIDSVSDVDLKLQLDLLQRKK